VQAPGRREQRSIRADNSLAALLIASAAASVALSFVQSAFPLAVVFACEVSIFGLMWGPAMALAADVHDRLGIEQLVTFGVMNVCASTGIVAGSAGGAAVAQLWGETTTYIAIAAICVVTALLLLPLRSVTSTPTDR
jgi:predicted MFS family arabinose efflux permease